MNKLLHKIRSDNPGKFDRLHLQSMELYRQKQHCIINFISPLVFSDEDKQLICTSIASVFPRGYGFETDFSKIYCDEAIAESFLREYIERAFPSLNFAVFDINVSSSQQQSGICDTFYVNLTVDDNLKDIISDKETLLTISAALKDRFKANFEVTAVYNSAPQTDDMQTAAVPPFQSQKVSAADYAEYGENVQQHARTDTADKSEAHHQEDNIDGKDREKREIVVSGAAVLFGKDIGDTAHYIEDYISRPADEAVLCGRIRYFTERLTKKQKKFYSFELEDFTGKIPCIIFTTKANETKVTQLADGTEIIACGKVEQDNFRGAYCFYVRHVSLCILPQDFAKVQKVSLPAPENYTVVFPKKMEIVSQVDFFGGGVKEVSKYFFNKTFTVFDIETTGLNYDLDKITEIGAIKIEDGIITSSFSTLINPEVQIREETVKLNGIDNELVKDSPKIYEVLPDFFKYAEGSTLVAHNIDFDLQFIKYNAEKLGYYFYHSNFDTLSIARQRLKGLSNYKLETLCAYFNIDLTDHHRAWNDALATAKLYIELMNLPEKPTQK